MLTIVLVIESVRRGLNRITTVSVSKQSVNFSNLSETKLGSYQEKHVVISQFSW